MNDDEFEQWCKQRISTYRKERHGMSRDELILYLDELAVLIVGLCGEVDDFDWPDGLHLADVLEKHVWRYRDNANPSATATTTS